MNNTFYLKYRPQTLDELDIAPVRESLKKVISSDQIPHAFLFAGPKGTGKTSAARILAKVINCTSSNATKPCNNCEKCTSIANGTNMDVVEMDAASSRGIDDIRSLRDIVKLAPAKSKAKVYIIDEAHMLTTEASNAFLKTLEEPPEHAYFILATTNPEKVIETIRSRATLIQFRKASKSEIVRSLTRIVKEEKLKVTDNDLEIIITASSGSFRDAVKLLERSSSEGSGFLLDEYKGVESLIDKIEKKDKKLILSDIEKYASTGISASYITEQILHDLRLKLLGRQNTVMDRDELIHLIELILTSSEQVKYSPVDELPLELAFCKWFTGIDGSDSLEKSS